MKTKLQISESRLRTLLPNAEFLDLGYEILDDHDVMEMLHISKRTLYSYNQEKILRSFRVKKKRFYIKQQLIEDFMRQMDGEPAPD